MSNRGSHRLIYTCQTMRQNQSANTPYLRTKQGSFTTFVLQDFMFFEKEGNKEEHQVTMM